MADSYAHPAGWYGKIPSLGDFASRRLTQQFISIWDDWLQRALCKSREQLGGDWLGHYLSSSVWRFALLPGLCDNSCWSGVMMPSVDKVGRHFPLVIAAPLPAEPALLCRLMAAHGWFDTLEETALACLDMTFSVDALEARLAQLHFPVDDASTDAALRAGASLASWWQETGHAPFQSTLSGCRCASLTDVAGSCLLTKAAAGNSLWWRCDLPANITQLHAFRGLPPESAFVDLLTSLAQAKPVST